MAKLDVVINQLQRRFSKALSTRDLRELGKEASRTIVRRTREGRGVRNVGGNERQLKPLSAPYIARRIRSKLDGTTSPSTSNLTFSGSMLRSIKTVSVKAGIRNRFELIVGPTGQKNIKKAEFVSIDRPFMNLSRKEIRKLTALMADRIRTNVRSR